VGFRTQELPMVGKVDAGALSEPLLRPADTAPRPPGLGPLFLLAFLNTASRIVAQTPSFCLQFQDLATDSGTSIPVTAAAYGKLTALRSLVELAFTPLLAQWSDRAGRKWVLCMCCAAYCVEYSLMAASRNVRSLCLVHILGGVLASHNAIEGSCIVDAYLSPQARAAAFGRLFMALGAAFVVAPALGGELSTHSRTAPFLAAAGLSAAGLAIAALMMPEYLPADRRRQRSENAAPTGGPLSSLGAFARLLARNARLAWIVSSSAFVSLGISAFISVRTFWARDVFGWEGRDIGRVVATYGLTLVAAQFVLLPLLCWMMRGHEALLAQLCLLVHVVRFTGYALAPSGSTVYTTVILSTAGSCSVPVLQGLCSRCVAEDEQGILSGGASAMNTAMQVIGSLVGSHVFAASLRGEVAQSATLLFSAGCCALAAFCLLPAKCLEASIKRRTAASWITQAEGMHGMDATLPSPTARGSLLLRSWVRRAAANASQREGGGGRNGGV